MTKRDTTPTKRRPWAVHQLCGDPEGFQEKYPPHLVDHDVVISVHETKFEAEVATERSGRWLEEEQITGVTFEVRKHDV